MSNENTAQATVPIVVKLGKQRKKRIKQLERGKGKLMDEVMEVVSEVKDQLGDDDALKDKVLVPIVIVYKEKRKRPTGIMTRMLDM